MVRTKGAPKSLRDKMTSRRRREEYLYREAAALQTHTKNLMPKAPFGRIVKEIMGSHGSFRITILALTALQEAVELYLTFIFMDANLLARHRKRVTMTIEDVQLLLYIREHSIR